MNPERGRALRDEEEEKEENTDGLARPERLVPPKSKSDGAEWRLW